jgi:uncharacterized protein YdhG (YjbR/CyaY superfamily)
MREGEMKADSAVPKNIDEYIASFPDDIQERLQKIRMTIREAAPDAEEKISYKMPAFYLKGDLVYFAAYKKHIGVYPTPAGNEQFQKKLAAYKAAKGTARFPLNKPIPFDLIRELVRFRIEENLGR